MTVTADEVLEFWLGPQELRDAPAPDLKKRWFTKSEQTDALLRERFGDALDVARSGGYDSWAQTARGRLALVIMLDQFTRNIQRGSGRMFENDRQALELALAGIDAGEDRQLRAAERIFLYMPLMHSESLEAQQRCCDLFDALAKDHPNTDNRSYAVQHRDIIARFGRFPHRNELLGRQSTPEEIEFLSQPGSSF